MTDLFIGTKPASTYTTAYISQVEAGMKTITLKARGRAINQAVNVLELLRNRILPDRITVEDVEFYTDEMEVEGQIPVKVSVISITTTVSRK